MLFKSFNIKIIMYFGCTIHSTANSDDFGMKQDNKTLKDEICQ